MPKLFMRDFEPHFNDDLYKVTNWNNWDRHTEAELYRGCAGKYALQLFAGFTTGIVCAFALLFIIGELTGVTLTTVEDLFDGLLLSIGVYASYYFGANKMIDLYLSNLDRVQETQDIMMEDD